MSVSTRKVSVIVDGSSSELQDAIAKSVDALKTLGNETAKQSQAAVDWGEKVVKSNDTVAASYRRVADAGKAAAGSLEETVNAQTSAQTKLAESATASSRDIVAATERQVSAYEDATTVIVDSSGVQRDAIASVATTANRTALDVEAAAEKQATAMRGAADATVASSDRSSAAVRDSNAKQAEGFAASGSGLVRLGKLTTETAAVVAAGSLYMSAKFESGTIKLRTQAGATEQQLTQMRKAILDMAGSLGQTPEHLDEGLYHIVSSMNKILPAATRTSEELKIMKVAAEGAAVGGTGMEETSYALASAMNALHEKAGDAGKTMGTLNAIVGAGDMTMSDLLGALRSGLIPTANQFGVSLQSVGAALATMGDMGMRGAMAGTRLRMSLALLGAPSAKAAEILGAIGMSAGEVTARTQGMTIALRESGLSTTTLSADLKKPDGLRAALIDLKEHLRESGVSSSDAAAIMVRAFGGGRMAATIDLLTQGTGRLGAKFDQINKQAGDFGKNVAEAEGTLTFQAHQAEGAIESLGIRIGQDLTPEAKELIHDLEETAKWLEHNKTAAELLAVTITGVLGLAVTAFLANRAAKMVQGLKEIGKASEWLRGGFQSPGTISGASTATAGAEGDTGVGASGMMIGGSRSGYGLPGSIVNPVVVAVESGEYAGLGGRSAAIGDTAASENAGSGIVPAGQKTAAVADAQAATGQTALFGPNVGTRAETEEAQGRLFTEEAPVAAGPKYKPSEIFAAANPEAAVGEEAAVTGGVMSGIRTGLGGVMANAMKGGMIALAGTFAAQIAGSAIGGKTGHAVKGILTDAALGGGAGMLLGPEGALAGGTIGALVGAVKELDHHVSQGQHVAETSAKGMGASAEDALEKGINKANKNAENELAKIRDVAKPYGYGHERFGPTTGAKVGSTELKLIEEQRHNEEFAVGKTFGKTAVKQELNVTAGMSGVAQLTAVITDTEKRLAGLPAAAKQGAFESIMEMVKEYQKDGKLPPTSVEELVHSIEGKFPALKQAFQGAGVGSIDAMNTALKGQNVLGSIEGLVNEWRNVFPQIPKIVGLNMTNAEQTFSSVMGQLDQLAHTGPESQRAAASAAYQKLRDEAIGYFATMRDGISAELKQLDKDSGATMVNLKEVFSKMPEAIGPIETAYHRVTELISSEMSTGVKETGKGTTEINSILKKELSTLGIGGTPSTKDKKFGPAPGGGGNALQPTGVGGSSGFRGLAQGGMLEFGHRGDAGRDTIPLSMGGQNIVVGAGETATVFTRHQRADIESRLPGGLPGVFANKRPNYMAQGGFVAEPGTNFTYGYEPQIVADLRKLAAELKETVYGISGYRSPAHSIAVGGFGNDPHTEGKAADIGVGSPTLASMYGVPESALHAVDLYRPFYPPDTAEANHVQIIGVPYGNNSGTPATGGVGGSPQALEAVAKQIAAPKVKGTGLFAQVAQAALNKVTAAANNQLGSGSIAGVPGKGGSHSANEALAKAMMVASGWNGGEWPSLQALWTEESDFDEDAVNPSSGAAGIAQELGHGAVPPTARGQIAWGLKYIRERYGSPAAAEAHERAFNWYEQGGIVGAESGLGPSKIVVKTPKLGKTTFGKPAKAPPASKAAHKGAAHAKTPNFRDLTAKLRPFPGLAATLSRLEEWASRGTAMSEEESLLGSMQSQPATIMPADMKYLTPTLQAGQRIAPGMTVPQAELEHQRWLQKNPPNAQTELQSELLSWIGGLDNHRLVTGPDVSVLSSFAKDGGLQFPVGYPMFTAQEALLKGQENDDSLIVKYSNAAINEAHGMGVERVEREHAIIKLQEKEYTRYKWIKQQEALLTTDALKKGLKSSEASYLHQQMSQSATEARQTYTEEIAAEKARHAPDKTLIAELEERRSKITTPSLLSTSAIESKKVSLLKNELQDELLPIEEMLRTLGGSRTTIGKEGQRGKIHSEIEALRSSEEGLRPKAQEAERALPTLKLTQQGIMEAAKNNEESIAPVTPIGTVENTALLQAVEAQNAILATEYAVSQSQFAVLKNFEVNVPHFEKGGPVLEDGLIYAHAGEHVVPREGTLVAGGSAPPVVHLHHETHIRGSAAPFLQAIDDRIGHPENVRVVSRMQGQRVSGFPGFATRR